MTDPLRAIITGLPTVDDGAEAEAEAEETDEGDADDVRRVSLTSASSVRLRRPEWAWRHRVPIAGVTLMPGREGLGKTALAAHLMARWTRGDLAGDRHGHPCDVIYVGTEDDRASILVPRLTAAGADLDRVFFVDLAVGAGFQVGRDAEALSAELVGRSVAAVVIDPLDGHLGSTDSHRKAEVQSTLAHLASLAQEHRCAVVGIAHLNKGDSRDVLVKVVGSVGFTTSVRSVLAVGEHPDDPGDRLAVLRKANMCDPSSVPALRFRVEGTLVDADDGGEPIPTARVVILGEEEGHDPNVILSVLDDEERTARTDAADWLSGLLDETPMPAREIKRLARDADIAERTLHRARRELGVVIARDDGAQGRPSTWALPGSCHPLFPPGGTKPETTADHGFRATETVSCQRGETGAGTEPGRERRTW